MAEKISSAAVGSHILTTLASLASQPTVHALARKTVPSTASNVKPLIEVDSSKWHEMTKAISPTPDAFLSALGTTRGQAGSFEAQRKIDYDLNLSLAQAAKESGVRVYVLISVGMVSVKSPFPYPKMKAELDEAVKGLGFEHTIILKPGLLLGSRQDSRPPEAMMRTIAKGMGLISSALVDFWAVDADIVGKAAVAAADQCIEGSKDRGLWVIDQNEIVKLGKKEWKGK